MISLVLRRCGTPLTRAQINRCKTKEIASQISCESLPSKLIRKSKTEYSNKRDSNKSKNWEIWKNQL